MGWGLILLYAIPNPATGQQHFGGSALALGKLSIFGWHPFAGSTLQIYVGVVALVANLLVALVVTWILRGPRQGRRRRDPGRDYHADEGDKDLRAIGVH